jgi:hypothetical protein
VTQRARGEAGTGLISTIAGVTVVLGFLLFATQLMVNLHGTTVVTGAAVDAARIAAGADSIDPNTGTPRPGATAEASRYARRLMGSVGDDAELTWGVDGDHLTLRVVARNPRIVVPALGGMLGFDVVDRTVRVRLEIPR